ncbi:hypothetical protein [Saliphagus infecundisoli]|uniref:Uncharacterized protein n=1 Tax=Saliphagus infecundisoli TaxID=1849069 RepID=A0ABD5QGX3_9EURY|nr:hypothetical protein [Saliphagus infecundisoli]
MTASTERRGVTLSLSHEEQWLLHHLMLDRMELEARSPETDPPSMDVYRIFDKLEAGTHWFTRQECRRLRDELDRYVDARDTPDRDRPTARRLLDRLDGEGTPRGSISHAGP